MPKATTATRNGVRTASSRTGRSASGPGTSSSRAGRTAPAAVEPLSNSTARSRPRQSQIQSSEASRGSDSPPAKDSYLVDHPHCTKIIGDAEEEIRQLRERLAEGRRHAESVQQLRGDKARLAAQVGQLNAQVRQLKEQLSTATANAQIRAAQENTQPFLQELYSDASSMMNKVCSRMDVSQFDKCLAGPGAGNVPLAGSNEQFAMNNYNVAPGDPFPGGVNDLADFRLYPTNP